MDYTQSIGDVTELICISEFIKRGYRCSIPYGNSAKYDFVVDVNNKFWRIQCKSSHIAHSHGEEDNEAFSFSAVTQTTNTKQTIRRTYTKEDIDYFATVFNNVVYLVPVDEVSTSKTLRLSPPVNGGSYNKAEDYLLDKFLPLNQSFLQSKINYSNRTNVTTEKHICKICGKEHNSSSDYCLNCSKELVRKVKRPSRDDLKALVRYTSFKKLGKRYGVSDKTISKWCKTYSLPYLKTTINKISDEEWKNI